MLRVFLSLSLFAAAYCSICCTPQQWEGMQNSMMGSLTDMAQAPDLILESVNVSYDAVNKRIAASHFLNLNNAQYGAYIRYILDYKNGVQYTFNSTFCRRTTLGPFQETCIPDDAKSVGIAYVGAGPGMLNVTTYNYNRGGMEYNVQVTSTACVPVGAELSGRYGQQGSGGYIQQALGYIGISAGIKDASVFVPPAICANSKLYNFQFMASNPVGF